MFVRWEVWGLMSKSAYISMAYKFNIYGGKSVDNSSTYMHFSPHTD